MENDNDWVLEVLLDLKEYAQDNDLPLLANIICDVEGVAQKEISLKAGISEAGITQRRSSLP
ncbi:hypothetical protein [Roseobacter sp. OBYS 0001]|uniref:hypothetical protein n=1 Tax=Roseobacter sp. OBYS 0001 TaxID=882651 RepID=UPI001BC14A40|nr:hypothetical protein [Roseobacter sp. OBYS 0001]GIT85026.1 hypothetical protein ROBYS_00420 [Roseobacter sp. OBYS 0001]